ncbi:mucin-6 [Drosophila ficusphila]|uniref:mucin-6 n=1 Tax=Drosophila ficusphila TaxID=30025 RepID=UPI001C894001|nr:mucin-6 [Drosophila ficusphila]XP_017056526.2 mucin-6 [Drosophila ficusphila]XP_017056527.2 mucin-6 [Drosophila ficusphila]XP_017056528.2 mucin-6 [Drosophila ficusphila]
MISERHKSRDLVTILGLLHLLLLGFTSGQVVEVLAQSSTSTAAATATATSTTASTSQTQSQTLETKTNGSQDEATLTLGATTVPRLDPNNNNEWRPLGHGDPLQKDPTYDYSPPALERVRYWAENNSTGQSNSEARKKELPPEVLRNKTKSEVLLLGVSSERVRVPHSHSYPPVGLNQHHHQHQQQQQQQQQAKYAAIRRSYYAPTQQQHSPQMPQQSQHIPMQHMPHTHLMPPPMMMMKSSGSSVPHLEYRHSMMATGAPTSYMSLNHMSSPTPKHSMTSSVIYHQPSMGHHTSMSSSTPWITSMPPHRLSYSDPHLQESMHTFSYSRPLHQQSVSYSPNSLPGHQSGSKAGLRKPWLHELLQKEVVVTSKPKVKPTMPATKYLMGTSKPHHPLPPVGFGISTTRPPFTYAPVTFVPGPPTIAVPTVATRQEPQPEIFITPTPQTSNSGFKPMLVTGTTTLGTTPSTSTSTTLPIYQRTTTTTSNRLLIPQTSNLAQRPTVAPARSEPTTDSLFSHYKQPPKPLLGPMYLIIEGHSKVKTYGQNELDPHSPKIVPVISKREPVVRIADPNEKRGTVESYQVKHLHTKTTPMTTTTTTTTTTMKPSTTKVPNKSPVYSTTKAPVSSTTKPTATTTVKTTKATTTKTSISSATPLIPVELKPEPSSGVNDLLSLLDNMFADAHEIASSTGSPPLVTSTASTVLKPVSTKLLPQQPEPRISSKAGSIESLLADDTHKDDEADEDAGSPISTETPPRATRQVFDYDQLPESRIKDGVTTSDIIEYADDEEEALEEGDETTADGELEDEEDEEADQSHNLLKRIDQFVDDVDDGDDDLEDLIEGLDEDDGEIEERRQQQH